jgi:hypothetical protein
VISYFLHLTAENSATLQYCLAQWYVFSIGFSGQLPFRRQFKLEAATQGTFI